MAIGSCSLIKWTNGEAAVLHEPMAMKPANMGGAIWLYKRHSAIGSSDFFSSDDDALRWSMRLEALSHLPPSGEPKRAYF